MNLKPTVLGLKRSFGFGDRLGLATPGHMDAIRGTPFLPVFAQQSIRELTRTQRQPQDVMQAAIKAVKSENWQTPWGADADHLQTREDVFLMAEKGYTFFTIDPSAHVNNETDFLTEEELESAYRELVARGRVHEHQMFDLYLNKKFNLNDRVKLAFDSKLQLLRAVVKYGNAIHHTHNMYQWIKEACGSRPYEVEMSVDETQTPTLPLEHLFVGLELKRLGIKVVSLAPRFPGDFEKGIDFKGDIAEFERQYRIHAEIAKYCGPYKLSIHSGSDKFSIYPVIGRLSGELLHVKTAGTSYLEALRVVCRTDKTFFREIVSFCHSRYETDKKTYHVSAKLSDLPGNIANEELERWYLEHESGRQILHVTFGSVLTAGDGNQFKQRILENLHRHADLYREVLYRHLGKHIQLLLKETE